MFTHGWAVAWGEEIRGNPEYREAARSWRWPMVLIMRAAPDLGLPELVLSAARVNTCFPEGLAS